MTDIWLRYAIYGLHPLNQWHPLFQIPSNQEGHARGMLAALLEMSDAQLKNAGVLIYEDFKLVDYGDLTTGKQRINANRKALKKLNKGLERSDWKPDYTTPDELFEARKRTRRRKNHSEIPDAAERLKHDALGRKTKRSEAERRARLKRKKERQRVRQEAERRERLVQDQRAAKGTTDPSPASSRTKVKAKKKRKKKS